MSTLREYAGELTVTRCWCGVQHAYPESLRREQVRQKDEGLDVMGVYCPLGHTHVPAGESKASKLEKRLQREQARHDQTKAELKHTESQRRAEKAAKTRIKNRVSKGVCPCCKRSFVNLRCHMECKHPKYGEEE